MSEQLDSSGMFLACISVGTPNILTGSSWLSRVPLRKFRNIATNSATISSL
jgi:hypothetical protein